MNNFNGKNNNLLNQNNINNFNNNNLNNFVQDYSSLIFIEEVEQYTMPLPRSFSVIFRECVFHNGAPVIIHIEIGDKVSKLIKKFEVDAGMTTKNNNFEYIFNAKPLDREMTVEEAGLTQDSYILCVEKKKENKKDNKNQKEEIKNDSNTSNNPQKRVIDKAMIDKWVLMEKKTINNHNQINNSNNIIIFFEITRINKRYALKISAPIYAKVKNVVEKVIQYLESIKFKSESFIFQNHFLNNKTEETLLEFGIKNGDLIINYY